VHRRDVRNLTRAPRSRARASRGNGAPLSLVGEVVARWLGDAAYQDRRHRPRTLQRAEFDAMVGGVSSDVRGRAMLDELLRLGAVTEGDDGIALSSNGFAPREGFAEMSELFAANLADHARAASANLQGEANFLEQAMYLDGVTPESVQRLQRAAKRAWTRALPPVLAEAQACSDADGASTKAPGTGHRVRFGVYFYSTEGVER
jgi:hypothetical protein